MGMSERALFTPMARPAVSVLASLRRAVAQGLGRAAYAAFYVAVLGLLVCVPLAVGYLLWHWLTH